MILKEKSWRAGHTHRALPAWEQESLHQYMRDGYPHHQQGFCLWRTPEKDEGEQGAVRQGLRKTVGQTKAGGSSAPPSSQTLLSSARDGGLFHPRAATLRAWARVSLHPTPHPQTWASTSLLNENTRAGLLGIFLTSTSAQWHAHAHAHTRTCTEKVPVISKLNWDPATRPQLSPIQTDKHIQTHIYLYRESQ